MTGIVGRLAIAVSVVISLLIALFVGIGLGMLFWGVMSQVRAL